MTKEMSKKKKKIVSILFKSEEFNIQTKIWNPQKKKKMNLNLKAQLFRTLESINIRLSTKQIHQGAIKGIKNIKNTEKHIKLHKYDAITTQIDAQPLLK